MPIIIKEHNVIHCIHFTEYAFYDTENDLSPKYTFANEHAEMEPVTSTFTASAPFRDQRTLEATGYVNPNFNAYHN